MGVTQVLNGLWHTHTHTHTNRNIAMVLPRTLLLIFNRHALHSYIAAEYCTWNFVQQVFAENYAKIIHRYYLPLWANDLKCWQCSPFHSFKICNNLHIKSGALTHSMEAISWPCWKFHPDRRRMRVYVHWCVCIRQMRHILEGGAARNKQVGP